MHFPIDTEYTLNEEHIREAVARYLTKETGQAVLDCNVVIRIVETGDTLRPHAAQATVKTKLKKGGRVD